MADRGRHEFIYAIYPHAGSWSEGQVVRRGQELNQPLLTCILDPQVPGNRPLPRVQSFFAVKGDGVIIDAIKLAEDGSGLVFRLYEANGKAENAVLELTFFRKPTRAVATDLLEKELGPLEVNDGRIPLTFRPFEIKTVKVRFE
jgi:alpha-mannosidase